MSDEARDAIKEFLKVRDKYLEKACRKSTLAPKSTNDESIFPFHYQTAWKMWQTSIKYAEYNQRDKSTSQKRYKYHIHALRKFFRSRMGNKNGIGVDMTEFLMGHEGYLTREYRHYSIEELGQEYLKGVERLLIFETPADTSDIREHLAEKDKQMSDMQRTIEEMKAQIVELRLEKLEKANGIKNTGK